MELLLNYFPELTNTQREQFAKLPSLYEYWNSMINVISRKDIDKLLVHHVLHSMAIAKVITFTKGTKVLDVGTGGGFPGIPLAIFFPDVKFSLVDSVGKKIHVTQSVAESLQLKNVIAQKARVEELNNSFDFAVTRAVAPLPSIMKWIRNQVKPGGYNSLPNGIIALKGGDLREELAPFGRTFKKWKIQNFFEEEYFDEKMVVYVPR